MLLVWFVLGYVGSVQIPERSRRDEPSTDEEAIKSTSFVRKIKKVPLMLEQPKAKHYINTNINKHPN